jgi:hypothetical protein
MPQEFRYSLTRICLRSGQLSLSRRTAEIFPQAGTVRALDTVDGTEFDLLSEGERRVSGMAEYFQRHRLGVNDILQLRLLGDGRVAVTAMPRRSRRDYDDPATVEELLDSLAQGGSRSEEEIRAIHEDMPASFPLGEALGRDERFRLSGGRWTAVGALGRGATIPTATSARKPDRAAPHSFGSVDERKPAPTGEAAAKGRPQVEEAEARGPAERLEEAQAQAEEPRHAAVTPYPRAVMFPGEAALNSKRPAADLRRVNRAREALTGFGYRAEGLPHGMLRATAELGRRRYSVLVRVLAKGERLDWAALLARRRENPSDHLAVFGDAADLQRLTAPADLARATLWSWDSIDRVQELSQVTPVGPFDLEPHFRKGGLFGPGLHQFERSIGRFISERRALSSVLGRLATLKAPSVFLVDDLNEDSMPRDQVVKALDLLAQAPFHLVARVDEGEYSLRHPVDDTLLQISAFALSLRDRLPGGGRPPRVVASGGVDTAGGSNSGGESEAREWSREDVSA